MRIARHLSPPLRRRLVLAACLATLALPAAADPTPAAQAEIDHLLTFVAASQCTFIRNGSEHPAPEARSHLADKLGFAKSRISSAEDFIRYLATESSLSGEPYKVRCAGKELPAGVWLTAELKRYRATPH
jgi:hypothetical protein